MNRGFRLLCVHQGAELYGSDRVFLQSVKALRQRFPEAQITVHVPWQGPLTEVISEVADNLIVDEIFVMRSSRWHFKNWRGLLRLIPCLKKSWDNIRKHDAVYINTVSIFGYLMLARFSNKKFVLHLHEYADGAKGTFLRWLVRLSGVKVIGNSHATAQAFGNIPVQIVHNGIADKSSEDIRMSSPFNLLFVGRINAWKGQGVAIAALNKLSKDGFKDIRLDIVGDVFEDQIHYRESLMEQVRKYGLEGRVMFHGYVSDPSEYYQKSHVVLVPSVKPEPFGLVAVEGMMWSLPVIAADHGGLREIVVQNETGFLVQPNSIEALAEAIRKYAVHPSLLKKHGNSGRLRYHALFTEEQYSKRFIQAMELCGISFSKNL